MISRGSAVINAKSRIVSMPERDQPTAIILCTALAITTVLLWGQHACLHCVAHTTRLPALCRTHNTPACTVYAHTTRLSVLCMHTQHAYLCCICTHNASTCAVPYIMPALCRDRASAEHDTTLQGRIESSLHVKSIVNISIALLVAGHWKCFNSLNCYVYIHNILKLFCMYIFVYIYIYIYIPYIKYVYILVNSNSGFNKKLLLCFNSIH